MKWKAEYSIGLEVIDNQHQQIFAQLLTIENSLLKRDPWHVLRSLTAELSHQLNFHFAVEEALMEILRFPDIGDHRAAHEKLNRSLQELEDNIRQSQSPSDLVRFFEAWFIGHVLEDDRSYATYAREKLPAQGMEGS